MPTAAIRMKIQRHSGPQERVDLDFAFPSLEAPEAPKHVSAERRGGSAMQPIDRIFLSIAAHHDTLAPDMRVRTIYPRYLEQASTPGQDGLTMRAFRDGTPYSGEDLFFANTPNLTARCTRDAATPGMCLSERRIDGADLTFRFPRSWLAQWRDVANAMDRLTAQLHGPKRVARRGRSVLLDQIVLEDRHLELERAVVVFIVDEQHADEFLADIDLGRIVLLRPRHHADLGIAEQALEIGVELPDFLNVHGSLQSDLGFGKF